MDSQQSRSLLEGPQGWLIIVLTILTILLMVGHFFVVNTPGAAQIVGIPLGIFLYNLLGHTLYFWYFFGIPIFLGVVFSLWFHRVEYVIWGIVVTFPISFVFTVIDAWSYVFGR